MGQPLEGGQGNFALCLQSVLGVEQHIGYAKASQPSSFKCATCTAK